MKIRHYIMTALVLLTSCFVSGCNDDDDNASQAKAVLASAKSLTFDGLQADPQIITVYSDAQWTAEVPEWIEISPSTGSGTTEVYISVNDNLRDGTLDNPRKAELVFKGATVASRSSVMVIQKGDNYRDCTQYDLSQVSTLADESYIEVKEVTVVVAYPTGAIVSDSQFGTFTYVQTTEPMQPGDKMNVFAQKLTDSQKMPYLLVEKSSDKTSGNQLNLPAPTDITDAIDTFASNGRDYITVEGLVVDKTIVIEGAEISVNVIDIPEGINFEDLNGHLIKAVGFFAGIAKPYLRLQLQSVTDLGRREKVYFSDDFEWLAPWTDPNTQSSKVSDTIGDDGAKIGDEDARQLLTNKVDGVNTLEALIAKGYDIVFTGTNGEKPRDKGKQTYLQRNYLKFGLTNQRSGLQLPAIKTTDEQTDAIIDFDWCTMRQGDGNYDATELVVIVANGSDVKQFPVETLNIPVGAPFKWYRASVSLAGATVKEGTVITIRPCDEQWDASSTVKTIRFFLDNIKVYTKL